MAEDTMVNSEITDSITQVNVQVLGDLPAMAMGNLLLTTSHALALAALNATNAQQQNNITAQAATTAGVVMLYSINTASNAAKARDILNALVK